MLAELVDYAVRRYHRAWHRRVAESFATFGDGSAIMWPLDALTEPGRVRIGDDVQIEGYFSVSAAASVTIGDGVLIGSNVAIRDHDHGIAPGSQRARQPLVAAPVEIGEFVWLSQNVVVLKGVTIGRNAVVGANAVVTRSVPEGAIAAGVPARQIGWVDGRPYDG